MCWRMFLATASKYFDFKLGLITIWFWPHGDSSAKMQLRRLTWWNILFVAWWDARMHIIIIIIIIIINVNLGLINSPLPWKKHPGLKNLASPQQKRSFDLYVFGVGEKPVY